jgi:hypothetical protein
MRRFYRGYKFKSKTGAMWEIVNYDDTDDLYICKCIKGNGCSFKGAITYFAVKDIEWWNKKGE